MLSHITGCHYLILGCVGLDPASDILFSLISQRQMPAQAVLDRRSLPFFTQSRLQPILAARALIDTLMRKRGSMKFWQKKI
jgi:hypothetical protein